MHLVGWVSDGSCFAVAAFVASQLGALADLSTHKCSKECYGAFGEKREEASHAIIAQKLMLATPQLSSVKATYFQSIIGMLCWIVELGRADIAMETSALASMMAMPGVGHLYAEYYMFAFLQNNHNSVMVFHPTEPGIDQSQFPTQDWSASVSYSECKEEIPPNTPKA